MNGGRGAQSWTRQPAASRWASVVVAQYWANVGNKSFRTAKEGPAVGGLFGCLGGRYDDPAMAAGRPMQLVSVEESVVVAS